MGQNEHGTAQPDTGTTGTERKSEATWKPERKALESSAMHGKCTKHSWLSTQQTRRGPYIFACIRVWFLSRFHLCGRRHSTPRTSGSHLQKTYRPKFWDVAVIFGFSDVAKWAVRFETKSFRSFHYTEF